MDIKLGGIPMHLTNILDKIVNSRILNTIETKVLGLLPSVPAKETPEDIPNTGEKKATVVDA